MQEWHDLRVDNIKLSSVHYATLGKISFTKAHLDGKTRLGFCFIINLLKNKTSTKDKGTNCLAMNKAKSSSNYFWLELSLL
jgi:hypothetical protein